MTSAIGGVPASNFDDEGSPARGRVHRRSSIGENWDDQFQLVRKLGVSSDKSQPSIRGFF